MTTYAPPARSEPAVGWYLYGITRRGIDDA
jgi:hypothetical protein